MCKSGREWIVSKSSLEPNDSLKFSDDYKFQGNEEHLCRVLDAKMEVSEICDLAKVAEDRGIKDDNGLCFLVKLARNMKTTGTEEFRELEELSESLKVEKDDEMLGLAKLFQLMRKTTKSKDRELYWKLSQSMDTTDSKELRMLRQLEQRDSEKESSDP